MILERPTHASPSLEQHATIKKLGHWELPNPEYGDLKLSVMPFIHTGDWIKLPEPFKLWEESLDKIMSLVPVDENGNNEHYITIDTKFFTEDDFLRREGIHIDGNFCADPMFKFATWGGTTIGTTWSGTSIDENLIIRQKFASPYGITPPIGEYISGELGGIITVSNEVGCQAWQGRYYGVILSEGDCSLIKNQCTDENKVVFQKDEVYFMTSNTPHETLLIKKGKRRTFLRVTLNHNYPNKLILDK